MKWITRVPELLTQAKEVVRYNGSLEALEPGYYGKEFTSEYGETEQRWLLVFSEKAYLRETKTVEKKIHKEQKEQLLELKRLSHIEFDCEKDAMESLLRQTKALKYHHVADIVVSSKAAHKGKGRPSKDGLVKYHYRITATLKKDSSKIDDILKTKGRFIIATNELDKNLLTSQELLQNYKGQQSVERGFRFLKEPAFMTPSVYLKSQKRIIALAMVMCLCLLVYTIAQRYIRKRLEAAQDFIPNQLGKPTRTPTMRWIFQIFEGVHLLIHKTQQGIRELVLNMNDLRCHILAILGPPFEKMYSSR